MRQCGFIFKLLLLTMAAGLLTACEREKRGFRVEPQAAETVTPAQQDSIRAGGPDTRPSVTHDVGAVHPISGNDLINAYAMSQGQQLFAAYNCAGCHGNGGGDKGPPLIDGKWIYGGAPQDIFTSITAGRPRGMPAFGGRIPDAQVWQLVAYVRSLSGHTSRIWAPGRQDHMTSIPAPNSRLPQPISQSPPTTSMVQP